MADSIVGTPQTEGDTSSSSTLVLSGVTHTAGNGLVLFTLMGDNGTVTGGGISNTAGDTWTGLTGTFADFGVNRFLGFYVPSTHGHASDVITITIDNGPVTYRSAVVFEVQWNTTGVFSNASTGGGTSTTPSTGSITLGAPTGILCAVGMTGLGTSTFTPGSGFTGGQFAITGDANQYYLWEYKAISGATAADGTLSALDVWRMSGASFQDVGASAGNGNFLAFV